MIPLIEFKNKYWKDNPQFFLQVLDLVENHRRTFAKKLLSKCSKAKYQDYSELRKWINSSLPLLQNQKYTYATKCYWILNGLEDFPICPQCRKKEGFKFKNVKSHSRYQLFCSQKCSANSKFTQMRIKEAFRENYGVDHPSQTREIHQKMGFGYKFDGQIFDSKPEIALYIWLRDKNIKSIYHPNKIFTFKVEGKTHTYQPDFFIEEANSYLEVKGRHFFNDEGVMICPFRKQSDSDEQHKLKCKIVAEKQKCMMKNKVFILLDNDEAMKNCFKYIKKKYGRNYIDQFKLKKLEK